LGDTESKVDGRSGGGSSRGGGRGGHGSGGEDSQGSVDTELHDSGVCVLLKLIEEKRVIESVSKIE
jgi:hypothetical protein